MRIDTQTPGSQERFPLLDGYRGAAVLAVVVLHAAGSSGWAGHVGPRSGVFFAAGFLGLGVFFTLSGFLLYRQFLVRQRAGASAPDVLEFSRRRVFRIFPAWWALLAVAWAWPGIGFPFARDWAAVWVLLQHYGTHPSFGAIGHSWSLAAEIGFYLALPALASAGRITKTRPIAPAMIVGAIVAVSFTTTWLAGTGVIPSWFRLTAPSVAVFFAFGMALAIVSVWWPLDKPPSLVGLAARKPVVAWTIAAAALAVLLADTDFHLGTASAVELTRRRACEPIAAAAVLIPGIFRVSDGGPIRRLLGSRVMTWIGVRSYGIYLWHFPIVAWVAGLSAVRLPTSPFDFRVQDHIPGPDFIVVLGATLALTVPIAAASYRFIERPFLRRRRGVVPINATEMAPPELAMLGNVASPGNRVVDIRAGSDASTPRSDAWTSVSRTVALARLVGDGHVLTIDSDADDHRRLVDLLATQRVENVRAVYRTGAAGSDAAANANEERWLSKGRAARGTFQRAVEGSSTVELRDLVESELPVDVVVCTAAGSEHLLITGMADAIRDSQPVMLVGFAPDQIDRLGDDPVAVLQYYSDLGYAATVVASPNGDSALGPSQLLDRVVSTPQGSAMLLLRPEATPAVEPRLTPLARGESPQRKAIREAVANVPFWFHSIDVGLGVRTPGVKPRSILEREWRALQLDDLRGVSVLDIGAWDGYFSFTAEEAGAERVVALDEYVWRIDRHLGRVVDEGLPGRAGFDLAHALRNSCVESIVADIATMDTSQLGTFDVVFFLGVLYHLRDPLGGLTQAASLTRGCCLIETQAIVAPGDADLRMWEFHPRDELNNDPTNWFVPTLPALIGACEAAGFGRVDVLRGPPAVPTGGQAFQYRAVVRASKT